MTFAQLWQRCSEFNDLQDLDTTIAQAPTGQLSPLATSTLRAEVLRRMGDPEGALGHLEPLLAPPNTHVAGEDSLVLLQAHHCHGFLLRWLGRFDEAGTAFIRALELNPGHTPSLNALTFTPISQRCMEALLPRLQQLQTGEPGSAALTRCLLADWSFQLGHTEQSLIWSYQAAKQSCKASQRAALDHLATPSLPEALIIGPPKCGTTSLAGWLSQHESIFMHPAKELHFFDNRWERGQLWYRCQFPSFNSASGAITRMEATPNYLQHPEIAARVLELMPRAKLIAIFRHPLERAISAYHHIRRQEGKDGESLNAVLETELAEIHGLSAPELANYGWHRTNCLFGSLYTVHLRRWQELFPPEQLLTLQLEALAANPQEHWEAILQFLDLPAQPCPTALPQLNTRMGPAQELDRELEQRCRDALTKEIEWWNGLGLNRCSSPNRP